MGLQQNGRRRWLVRGGLVLAVVTATAAIVGTGSTPILSTKVEAGAAKGSPVSAVRAALSADGVSPKVRAALTPGPIPLPAADSPTCPDPFLDPTSPNPLPLPAATFPNGTTTGFGVPFVAALTHGALLTGFDESPPYAAQPWKYLIGPRVASRSASGAGQGINGWAAGVLQVPSLAAHITSNDVVLCNQPGNPDSQVNFSSVISSTQGNYSYLSNYQQLPAVPGTLAGTVPYNFTLIPGPADLKVVGVDPVKGLQLAGSASTLTQVTNTLSGEVCNEGAYATVPLQSSPQPEPLTGPKIGGQLISGLNAMFAPSPLTGAFPGAVQAGRSSAPATAMLASDSFTVPLFTGAGCKLLPIVLDVPLEGWNARGCHNDTLYVSTGTHGQPCKVTTTEPPTKPGWSQFGITTTVAYLGLPVNTPSGFGF